MSKRKVLIISYVWPPMEGVGLVRAMKFSKYLPKYGWEPAVLTVKSPGKNDSGIALDGNIKVFRTEYKDAIKSAKGVLENLMFWHKKKTGPDVPSVSNEKKHSGKNKVASAIREFVAMPDEQVGWYEFAIEAGKKIMDEEGIDLIFSTSPPETAHLIARTLKRYHAVPWVADLRDLWANDHYRERPLLKKTILRSMEKKVFKDADKVVTVSRPWAEVLRTSVSGDKITVIENGFDEDDFKALCYRQNEKFTISYTGKLHKVHQPVHLFLKALSSLIKDGIVDKDKIEARFYVLGYDRPDISAMAERYGLMGIVTELDKVSYAKSLEVQRASDLLLFVQWMGDGSDGWYSAKLYDYIGARRPILALAKKDGIVNDLINRTSSGVVAQNETDLKDHISRFYDEYMKNGSIKYSGHEEEIVKNSRAKRTAELANLFTLLAKG